MKWIAFLRRFVLGLMLCILVPLVPAQQNGQTGNGTGRGAGNNTGSSNSAGSNTAGGNTAASNTTGRSSSRSNTNASAGNDSDAQYRRQPLFSISGSVVLEDGTPPPVGAVIERVCSGRTTKEAYVDPAGGFWFQVGANNNNLLPDASDPAPVRRQVSPGMPSSRFSRLDSVSTAGLAGCELRARLGGYRSSVLLLTANPTMGQVEVGTIVLYPAERVRGTMVSATSLAAPKDARKALERAEKAIQKTKLEEAEKDLDSALVLYPRYAAAWLRLGQLYERASRTDDARNAFSKALEADSNYVSPYIELARIAAIQHKWQESADLTDRAVTLDPLDSAEGFYLNAVANYNLNNLDAAERSSRRAQRLDSLHRLPQAHLVLAAVLQRKRDFAGAAEQLRSYLKYAPDAADAAQVRTRLLDLEKFPDRGSLPVPLLD